jgi:hypothetical protein
LCGQVASDRALAYLCFGDIVESGEWLARRDQLLKERVAGLFESAGLASFSAKQPETEASLGAVLGLLQNEVAAGRAGSAQRIAPTLAYLALAPTAGGSSAMVAMCEDQKIENMTSKDLCLPMTLGTIDADSTAYVPRCQTVTQYERNQE